MPEYNQGRTELKVINRPLVRVLDKEQFSHDFLHASLHRSSVLLDSGLVPISARSKHSSVQVLAIKLASEDNCFPAWRQPARFSTRRFFSAPGVPDVARVGRSNGGCVSVVLPPTWLHKAYTGLESIPTSENPL